MDWLADTLFGWFFDVLYILQSSICVVVDFIVETFYKLSGLEAVSVDGKETDLLSHFIQTPAIQTAFLGVFLVGVILLCVFVLIAIIRSEYADRQHKKTKGQILVKAGQSFIIFLIIPLLLATGILLTNTVMNAINGSMLVGVGGTGHTSFGGQILATSGYNAFTGSAGARAEIERKFITGELDYTNLSVVKQYYDLSDMNFFIGIFSGLILVVMFALAALRFVQRLFDVILLYVISPVSVATIPLDDGARFKLWREMLISKVLSAYGIIFAMNLFFLIVPQVNRIQFFSNGFQNGLISLLFIIGGAFAVTKAYMVIAQLTGSNAGAQEAQQTMAGIYSGIRMARGAVRFGAGAIGQVIGGSDFRSNQRKGMGFGENVKASIDSSRNQRVVNNVDARKEKDKDDKEKQSNGIPANDIKGNNVAQSPPQTDRDKQTSFTDKDGRQTHNEDREKTQTDTDGGQIQHADKDNAQAPILDKDNNQSESNNAQAKVDNGGRDGMTAGQKAAHIAGGAGRLSTLPVGILKDLMQGGLITTAKNMWPRLRNIAMGRGIINHADVRPKGVMSGDKPATANTMKPEATGTVKPDNAKPKEVSKTHGGKK
jgi:hypothetical protein